MRASWWRKMVGRSLLRDRAGRRSCPIGECPSCGANLHGPSDWLDADRVMTDHLLLCATRRAPTPAPLEPRRAVPTLRLA
jgi:hypothetical protein